MTGGIVTVENLTYTQIKEMMIQRWESMKALGLNEKGNKGKEKAVEEKEESGIKTALNAFKRDGRERGSITTTSPLQSQDFVDTLIVIDTRRVDGVERKSLDTGQCQEGCINTFSQRLYSLLSENLIEKVILNLTDCDSLSNHVTAKITDEKVISLTESVLY
jgi:hypothetical protein